MSIVKSAILGISLVIATAGMAQKKDKGKSDKSKFLEGKKYDVQFTEKKATSLGKPLPSVIVFKSGNIQNDLMEEKLTAPSMPYKVTVDTTYMADEDSVHKVTFISDFTEEKVSYKWEATITDYEIEGVFLQFRSGVEKKRFEFQGQEKAGKSKK